jgi:hypothetical protein
MSEPNNPFALPCLASEQHFPANDSVGRMKTKLLTTTVCVLALMLSGAMPTFASGSSTTDLVVDVALARPISFAATIAGSVLFVVSLPIAATSHSIDKTAHTMVVAPAKDTFTRPLGDFDDFLSY